MDAVVPKRQTSGSVGHDLVSVEEVTLLPHSLKLIDTGIGIHLPEGCYGRVAPRSGMGLKGIDVHAGVIDPDWNASIKVILFNHMDAPYEIKKGDRIAQLILERVYLPVIKEVDELSETDRGDKGFGSTGR